MRRGFSILACLALALCTAITACRQPVQRAADPRAAIARGWDLFRRGEFNAAIEAFESAEAGSGPADPSRVQAVYGQAVTWNLRRPDQDFERARSLYQRVIDAAPQTELAAWSLFDEAIMLYPTAADVEPDWDAIAQGYQKVIDRFPNNVAAEQALMAQQSIVLQRFDPASSKEAVGRLEKFVADHPDSHFKFSALVLASCGYETLGQWREFVDARKRAAEVADEVNGMIAANKVVGPFLNKINWMTNCWAVASVSEFQLGDFATAREYYNRLVTRAPADPLYGAAIVALQRMDDKEAEIRRGLAGAH